MDIEKSLEVEISNKVKEKNSTDVKLRFFFFFYLFYQRIKTLMTWKKPLWMLCGSTCATL